MSNGIDSLRQTLKQNILRFDAESTKHKRLYRRCQTTTIALSAATSIVAGVGLLLPRSSGAVEFSVLCLTTIGAAVTGWAEMRRARELWQHEREVYYSLVDIERGMEFIAANRNVTPEDLETIFEKVSAVLGSSSQKWARIQDKDVVKTH